MLQRGPLVSEKTPAPPGAIMSQPHQGWNKRLLIFQTVSREEIIPMPSHTARKSAIWRTEAAREASDKQ